MVARIAQGLGGVGLTPDLTDDCAWIAGATALVSTDALVEGRHFDLTRDTPEEVGAQAAVANLSDLAGSGGAAGWMVWSLIVPPHWGAHLEGLAAGFGAVAAAHGATVVGGNLARAAGPASISVTVGGPLAGPRGWHRRGARPGDAVYVTGALGDAALGHLEPDATARARRHRWRPHLTEAAELASWGAVSAGMDVSDGLLLDAHRLAAASGVAMALESDAIPVSPWYRERRGADLEVALSGGEDYVLLFTAPPDAVAPAFARRIGRCLAGGGLRLDGRPVAPRGHDHFGGLR